LPWGGADVHDGDFRGGADVLEGHNNVRGGAGIRSHSSTRLRGVGAAAGWTRIHGNEREWNLSGFAAINAAQYLSAAAAFITSPAQAAAEDEKAAR